MNHFKTKVFILLFCLYFSKGCSTQNEQIIISADIDHPKIQFAVEEIKTAFQEKGVEVDFIKSNKADIVFLVEKENSELKPQGFSITKKSKKIRITGFDESGLMYGGL